MVTCHMPSLLRSNKAQFFVLSSVVIISMIFLLSKLFEPTNIIDTSSIVFREAPFIFENVKEKAAATVKGSVACEDAKFNLEEYKNFVEAYALRKGYSLYFNYTATPCYLSPDIPFPVFFASVKQMLKASDIFIESDYVLKWP